MSWSNPGSTSSEWSIVDLAVRTLGVTLALAILSVGIPLATGAEFGDAVGLETLLERGAEIVQLVAPFVLDVPATAINVARATVDVAGAAGLVALPSLAVRRRIGR
jgi:hypothetical protein